MKKIKYFLPVYPVYMAAVKAMEKVKQKGKP